MTVVEEIQNYIDAQNEIKKKDLEILHQQTLPIFPNGKLWFEDGKIEKAK